MFYNRKEFNNMLNSKTTTMKWHSRNKEWYIHKGYKYTFMGDNFNVKIKDLPLGSKAKVIVICDYCGKEMIKPYRDYLKNHSKKFGDTCIKCKSIKSKDTCINKYGVDNPSKVEKFKAKRKNTHLDRYGVENAFQAKIFKDKSKKTCLSKYGTEYANQNNHVKKKIANTNMIRYGHTNPNKNYNVRRKIAVTLNRNGSCKTSKAQLELFDMLKELYNNVELNYPVDNYNLDCMITIGDVQIDCEYDGWYWHKNKQAKDKKRDEILKTKGFKIFRIKANRELPTKKQILKSINHLVKGDYSYTDIKLDI